MLKLLNSYLTGTSGARERLIKYLKSHPMAVSLLTADEVARLRADGIIG